MADTVKISELSALSDPAAADLLVVVDISEALDADKTKNVRLDKIPVVLASQVADGILTAAKLADDARRICAKVLKNGDQTIPAASNVHLTSWSESFDEDELWDGTNNRFEIQEAGVYAVYLNGIIDDNLRIQARIRHESDGTNQWLAREHFENSNTYSGFSAFAIGLMEEGDYLYPYVYNDQASDSYDVLAVEGMTYNFYTQFGLFKIS